MKIDGCEAAGLAGGPPQAGARCIVARYTRQMRSSDTLARLELACPSLEACLGFAGAPGFGAGLFAARLFDCLPMVASEVRVGPSEARELRCRRTS